MERSGEVIPEPSPVKELATGLGENKYLVVIEVFMPSYRYAKHNKATKVTTTIPMWMKVQADQASLNYSDLLKDAIQEKLRL